MRLAKSKLLNVGVFKSEIEKHLSEDKDLPLAPFKQTIKNALELLRSSQNQGVSAQELVEKYTWMIDQLVVIAWQHYTTVTDKEHDISVELLAVGGYGRAELHPFSDVDLLILLKDNLYDEIKATLEPFLRFLWDIGLEVGHSVRSSKDCLKAVPVTLVQRGQADRSSFPVFVLRSLRLILIERSSLHQQWQQ